MEEKLMEQVVDLEENAGIVDEGCGSNSGVTIGIVIGLILAAVGRFAYKLIVKPAVAWLKGKFAKKAEEANETKEEVKDNATK